MSIAIAVLVVVFAWLSLPTITIGPRGGPTAQVLSNMRQLHLATQQMTLDYQTTGESPARWTCSGTTPLSFDHWHKLLVPDYLSEKDFQKLLSVSKKGFWGTQKIENALTVFAVCEPDAPDTVFLATKNWHPGVPKLSEPLFETKEFVIFHKGGDGAILQARQTTATNIIGGGGIHNFLPLK